MDEDTRSIRVTEDGEDGVGAFLDIIYGLFYLIVVMPLTAMVDWWLRKHGQP